MQAEIGNRHLIKFVVAAVVFYAWSTIQGALQAQGPIHEFIDQGPAAIIVGAHVHVGLLGWVSLALAALIYYLVPVLTNKPIAAPRLIDWIFWIWVVDGTIQWALMIIVGIIAGNAFTAGIMGHQLEAIMVPYMIPIGILSLICGIVSLMFVIQVLVTIARKAS